MIDDADWMLRPGYATAAGRRAGADEIDEHLARWASVREMRPLVEVLQAHEIPAAAVTPGADVIDHPHLRARGFVESFEHPVIGRHEVIGLPFRLRSRGDEGWNLTPAPTLGQHNREVCTEILGLREDELAVLAESGVIGARLAGH